MLLLRNTILRFDTPQGRPDRLEFDNINWMLHNMKPITNRKRWARAAHVGTLTEKFRRTLAKELTEDSKTAAACWLTLEPGEALGQQSPSYEANNPASCNKLFSLIFNSCLY